MSFVSKLFRKKTFSSDEAESSDLTRCLGTFDLVTLGVGSTLGAGAYVLTGSVSRDDSGPAIIISFAIAAACSLLAGLCYAEFGSRVPKAGSAYIYSYVTVGEFWGFVIGWNLILEYIIGVSSVARAWSANLDSLTGGKIGHAMNASMPMHVSGLAPYPDFLSVGIIALITVLLSVGMKLSSVFMTVLTAINILVLTFGSIAGFTQADTHNWNLNQTEVHDLGGEGIGGFMPFGASKMLEGAASCFYAFVGFDVIACVGEEAKNPSKSIPRAILWTLSICFVAYAAISCALTLMQPYCLIDSDAPLPAAFKYAGLAWASKPIAVGSMMALSASLLGAAVGMPRIVFSMARDGVIFKFLAQVNESGTPVIATIVSGIFSAGMALIFDLDDLVNMMSIGTLMAYTLVAACVLILRYTRGPDDEEITAEIFDLRPHSDETGVYERMRRKYGLDLPPTEVSAQRVVYFTVIAVFLMFGLSMLLIFCQSCMSWWGYLIMGILALFIVAACIIVSFHPQTNQHLVFKTPLVPLIPFVSIFVNLYLMLKLPSETWLRFAIWMAVGFLMYFGYGIRNSVQGQMVAGTPNGATTDYERFENEELPEAHVNIDEKIKSS